jgi:Family of unknown function (DUF6262)
MRADNSPHIIAARRRAATRKRAVSALQRMDNAGLPISFEALTREAGISRSWLYNQPDLRAEVERLRNRRSPPAPARSIPDRQHASEASLLQRLESATERIRHLEAQNKQLQEALTLALGQPCAADVRHSPTDTPRKKSAAITEPY